MATISYSFTFLKNNVFCVQQKKETHTALEEVKGV